MKPKNKHHFSRYVKFIRARQNRLSVEGEVHHVLPRCVGGTDRSHNLIKLTYREHYIAHYMLAKAYGGKLWFAFNMMRRVCGGKSVLYESARKYISKAISESNTGRLHTDISRKLMSEQRSGAVTVRDRDGNRFRVSVNDPRYISGELVFYRTGTRHKRSTIVKMKEGGLRGRSCWHDPDTHEYRYFKSDEQVPDTWEKGSGPAAAEKARNRPKNTWYTHTETGKWKRFKHDETIPDGYVKGRKGLKRDELGRIKS